MKAPTKQTWRAVLLGLLTVPSTLAVGLVSFPYLVVLASFGQPPWLWNALLGLVALTGNAIAAVVSYRVFRSRRLAAVTLGAALATQALAYGVDRYYGSAESARSRAARRSIEADFERIARRFAALGATRYEVSERLDGPRDNHHPELGPIYRRLTLVVPVTVRHAGIYHIKARFQARTEVSDFRTGLLESVDTLGVGSHEVRLEFSLGEWDYPGLWSPASTGGRVTAELYDTVDQAELIRGYREGAKGLTRAQLNELKDMESAAGVLPCKEMRVDSLVTEFPGGVRYPKDSRWGPAPEASRASDKEEETRRRRDGEGARK